MLRNVCELSLSFAKCLEKEVKMDGKEINDLIRKKVIEDREYRPQCGYFGGKNKEGIERHALYFFLRNNEDYCFEKIVSSGKYPPLEYEPLGRSKFPDFRIQIGLKTVGIEISELASEEAMKENAYRKKEVDQKGFHSKSIDAPVFRGNEEMQKNALYNFCHANYPSEGWGERLQKIILRKEKIAKSLTHPFDEMLLVVFSNEYFLPPDFLDYIQGRKWGPWPHFDHVFLLFEPPPSISNSVNPLIVELNNL